MDFSNKLNYLFQLSGAEGKELAAAMNITPPQISKMRRGNRGLPRNKSSARTLALFFARRCGSEQMRAALSAAIRSARVKSAQSDEALADIILEWLSADSGQNDRAAKRADVFLRQFGSLAPGAAGSGGEPRKALSSGKSSVMAYYGSEGKRLATESFLNYIAQRKERCVINLLTDESVDWLYEDAAFSRRFQQGMVALTEQGCCFRRISGPILDMDQAFESLDRWFPLYLTGKATAYYYKRMRDNLNRMSLFVVQDTAVLFSFSVGTAPRQDSVTFFTTDQRTVNTMLAEFENYLGQCEPIMKVYTVGSSSRQMHECMLEYDSSKGNCIQRNESLSFITLPWDVATTLRTSGEAKEKNEFLTSFAQRYKRFRSNLEQYQFTDIIRLADVDAVMAGAVRIPGSFVLGNQAQYYTPAGYLLHLRGILYLLEHCKNYNVALRKGGEDDNIVVYVKDDYCALLTLASAPFSVFEVSERYLVNAFMENLRRQIPTEQSPSEYRFSVIQEISALIEQLEQRLRSKED